MDVDLLIAAAVLYSLEHRERFREPIFAPGAVRHPELQESFRVNSLPSLRELL
jgi:hypothetical protein